MAVMVALVIALMALLLVAGVALAVILGTVATGLDNLRVEQMVQVALALGVTAAVEMAAGV
jgi:hypothetical protein